MNCLSRVSSYTAAIFGRASHFISRTGGPHQCLYPLSKRSIENSGVKAIGLDFVLRRFPVQCYSSGKASEKAGGKASRKKKSEQPESSIMEQKKDEFFVVRKGDIVGVYKNFGECQAQIGSSVCDPPASIFKGCSLPSDSEAYLRSHGLQNALYTIRAADLKNDLFGKLVPCSFEQPASSREEKSTKDVTKKRSLEDIKKADGSTSFLTNTSAKHAKLDNQGSSVDTLSFRVSITKQLACLIAENNGKTCCVLEFDGASKGNPGKAGAGAVLRTVDGSMICRLREGVGVATNNVAEYRALILGLKYALEKGYRNIRIHGDSKLVCMQIQGLWKVKHQNMATLYEQAKKLKERFLGFEISHVLREFNSAADAQANLAIQLADGQVQEVFE